MMSTLILLKVARSGAPPAVPQNSDFSPVLLYALAIIFLVVTFFLLIYFRRKEGATQSNGGFLPRKRRVGLFSTAMLVLPLLGLIVIWTGVPSLSFPTSPASTSTPTPRFTAGPIRRLAVTPPNDLIKSGILTVGSDTTYPPQEYLDGKNAKGFDIDLISAIAGEMGLNVKVVSDSSDNLLGDLAGRRFDVAISALAISPANQQQAQFIPYLTSVESLLIKSTVNNIKSLTDLCGLNVGVLDMTAAQNDLKAVSTGCASTNKGAIVFTSETNTTIIGSLQNGTIDVAYLDTPVANYYVKQNNGALKVVGNSVPEKIQEGIAVRKGDSSMFKAIQDAFKLVKNSGIYNHLIDQWKFASEKLALIDDRSLWVG